MSLRYGAHRGLVADQCFMSHESGRSSVFMCIICNNSFIGGFHYRNRAHSQVTWSSRDEISPSADTPKLTWFTFVMYTPHSIKAREEL